MQWPLTPAAIAEYLALPETRLAEHRDYLESLAAAVTTLVARYSTSTPTPTQQIGGLMLAARLYRRRNSPAGVEVLGDLGATYVSKYDSDLAMMIGLGHYTPPRVG